MFNIALTLSKRKKVENFASFNIEYIVVSRICLFARNAISFPSKIITIFIKVENDIVFSSMNKNKRGYDEV